MATILIPLDRKHLWNILDNYKKYTREELEPILNIPITDSVWEAWCRDDDVGYVKRQLLVVQGQKPKGCCQ